MEMLGRGDDHDIAPAFLQIGSAARRDGLVLRGPEGIGVGEIAVVAEQVGNRRALELAEVEQSEAGGDRLPAEQPRLQLVSGGELGRASCRERLCQNVSISV